MENISDIRKEYMMHSLDELDAASNPIDQFAIWWDNIISANIDEPNAMTLATVGIHGKPSARVVLLKGFDKLGFVFYTNYESRKGMDLQDNPNVCLVFYWKELERQVRIEGIAEKSPAAISDDYFASRPHGSQIGAWASPQSSIISNREMLDQNTVHAEAEFSGKPIPRPPHWGGYIVKPRGIEFWQGRPSRLHDRILYTLQESGKWKIERLAP